MLGDRYRLVKTSPNWPHEVNRVHPCQPLFALMERRYAKTSKKGRLKIYIVAVNNQ